MFLASIDAFNVFPLTDDVTLPVIVAGVAELIEVVKVFSTLLPSSSEVKLNVMVPASEGV